MKKSITLLASLAMLGLFSCNGGGQQKNETSNADTSATTTPAPVVQKPAFTPFDLVAIRHPVKDYAKWLPMYKSHDSVRMAYGVSQFAIGREIPDSNKLIVFDKISDIAKAKEFTNLPDLKETMAKAGVTGKPTFDFVHVIRFNDSITQPAERMMVKHHVKDFDAWLKVYDGEGASSRASNGLIDKALSRGIDDSNMVYIVFVVTDMAKAKARASSPELKKIMQDAGVDGPPTVTFYKVADVAH
ncbi:MAG TPA: hypothetical protein VG847_01555 [Chitinophagaceae bacterium]|nr:hypothetical protein [Chitinophagaceae bacterium]